MSAERTPVRLGERFTVGALLVIAVSLGYVRFVVLPSEDRPEPLEFHFVNPMLDARVGERVLFFSLDNPSATSCAEVMEPGLVLRPNKGPEHLGIHRDLRTSLPYLACGIHTHRAGGQACGGEPDQVVLYGLNYFGMPADTQVRVDAIRPRWMAWGDRELPVYEVTLQRYGALAGHWTTWSSAEAPVAGLVKWSSLLPHQTVVVYREMMAPGR